MRTFSLFAAVLLCGTCLRAAPAVPPYESDSFVPGVNGRKTGFFHVEEIDGRWWVVDPLGRGTVIRGCDGITFYGPRCEALKACPYGENNRKTYPSVAAWETNTIARLKAWGFNMLGNCRVSSLRHRGLAHAIPLGLGNALCSDFDNDALWIGPDLHVPRTLFPNVFHPDFAAYCQRKARELCAPNRDDPWLLGYFLDNELAWNGWKSPDYRGRASASTHVHSNRDPVGGLFDTVLAKRPDHTARLELVRFMDEHCGKGWETRPVAAKTKLAFLEHVAETYFGTMARAIRAADPNHMILGARFDGLAIRSPKVLPEVWRAAGRHCDVISFNCYPWADLDRNVVRISRAETSPATADVFRHFYEIARRPFLVTEWSFPALDSGLPCTVGAGQRFHTQAERVKASELFARTILGLPFMVGYDYFKWVDQPALGCSRAFPEDSNYGLVNVEDRPYEDLVSLFTRLHGDIAACRAAGVPSAREIPPDPGHGLSRAAASLARAADPAVRVTYTRTDDAYRVDNGAGCVWAGRVGDPLAFDAVTLNGRTIGSMGGMISHLLPSGRRQWMRTTRVERATWDDAARRMTVVMKGGDHGWNFRLTARFTFVPGCPHVLCEETRLENLGKRPLTDVVCYFRQHAPYERDCRGKTQSLPARPVWKDPVFAGWYASDGRRWSALTGSDCVRTFRYYVGTEGTIHPDAAFDTAETVPPSAAIDLAGVWMVASAGEGDEAAFRREARRLFGVAR